MVRPACALSVARGEAGEGRLAKVHFGLTRCVEAEPDAGHRGEHLCKPGEGIGQHEADLAVRAVTESSRDPS